MLDIADLNNIKNEFKEEHDQLFDNAFMQMQKILTIKHRAIN